MGGKSCREFHQNYALTEENLYKKEMEVLLLSDLLSDEIKTKNVFVGNYKKEEVYIRTIICGSGPEN